MSNTRNQYNNNVLFVLQSGYMPTLELHQEPEGWKEDELEITRHQEYHGTFTQFTGTLRFYDEAKDYIYNAFRLGGLNTDLYLIKYELREKDGDIKRVIRYIALADFETYNKKGNSIGLNFNSNALEQLIEAHQNDTFNLEREDSIDSLPISELVNRTVKIEGRDIVNRGETDVMYPNQWSDIFYDHGTPVTKLIAAGPARHSTADIIQVDPLYPTANAFFVDDLQAGDVTIIDVEWDIKFMFRVYHEDNQIAVSIKHYRWNEETQQHDVVQEYPLATYGNGSNQWYELSGSLQQLELLHTDGLYIDYKVIGGWVYTYAYMMHERQNIKINTRSYYPATESKFIFVDDALSKIMEILTGKRKKFYSKLFGRKSISNYYNDGSVDYNYENDGKYGLIGLISGFWVRNFNPQSANYKSMQLSLKDTLSSIHAVFCTGMTLEPHENSQRLRVEDLKYFYQNEIAIILPHPVTDLEYSSEPDLWFSGTELGYENGGDYENEIGLDEPNTKTSTVTPLRKTKNKYRHLSKINSDEYGLEITRRKPEFLYPDEDTRRDDFNWFLDLKRGLGSIFNQKLWFDRLEELPTGVLSPETYKSALFSPMRILFRHGWIIRAGMEQAVNMIKYVKHINSYANKNLMTWFLGEEAPIGEKDDVLVKDLERPRFLARKIKFKHPIDDDLMDKIHGYTRAEVEGSMEDVPNVYFKIEFTNDEGEKETGYLMNLKPKNTGEFELLQANENILF